MQKQSNPVYNDPLAKQALAATNDELISMYIKGTNKYAVKEMRIRGIY